MDLTDANDTIGSGKGPGGSYYNGNDDAASERNPKDGMPQDLWQKPHSDGGPVRSVRSDSSNGQKAASAPLQPRRYKNTETSSTSSMSLPETSIASEQATETAFPARGSGPDSPNSVVQKDKGASAQRDPFNIHELQEYNLPPWPILSEVFDFYYTYINPNFVLLPNKNFFLKRLALNSDSSVIHAIIAVVCAKRKWQFEQDESYWLGKMYQFWDNLNDFGMLLCYTLIQQALTIKNNFHKLVELNDKIYEVIQSNRYLDVLLTLTNLNSRKRFENEALIRMIWIYWVESLIFRLRQGRPYSKLFMMRNDNVLVNSDITNLPNRRLPLPLPNESYVKCQDSRRVSWDDLNKGIAEDSTTPIKAALILQQVMEGISTNELTKNNLVLAPEFKAMLKDRLYLVKEDTLILNSHFIVANFLFLHASIIQRCHFINHLLAFGALMHSTMKIDSMKFGSDELQDYIPRLNTLSINSLINLEELPSHIANMDDFQWSCLIEIIDDTMSTVDLINVHLGIIPSETTQRFSVLYGVTSLDATRDWFMSKELITRGESTWLKACDFSLFNACLLVGVIPSLIVLRNLFEIKSDGQGKSKAVMIKDLREFSFDVEVSAKVVKYFDKDVLLSSFNRVLEFVRFRAPYDMLSNLQQDTITNINKVGHYMEEILQSMK